MFTDGYWYTYTLFKNLKNIINSVVQNITILGVKEFIDTAQLTGRLK